MRDLLGDHRRQEVVIAPLLGLGTSDEVAPRAAGVGERESLAHGVEIQIKGLHEKSSCCEAQLARVDR